MSVRRKAPKLAPWIPMDRHQYKSAAFAALSAVAQAMLVHLTYNYNTKMMNSVWMSARDAAKKLNVSKTTAAKALLELEHYGFIVKVQGAYLGVSGVGKSAHYRLTAQRYGNLGATSARRRRGPADAPIGHSAGPPLELTGLKKWTTPSLTEIAYTEELRQLYAATEPSPDSA
jgi:predicted transcriptional regulator